MKILKFKEADIMTALKGNGQDYYVQLNNLLFNDDYPVCYGYDRGHNEFFPIDNEIHIIFSEFNLTNTIFFVLDKDLTIKEVLDFLDENVELEELSCTDRIQEIEEKERHEDEDCENEGCDTNSSYYHYFESNNGEVIHDFTATSQEEFLKKIAQAIAKSIMDNKPADTTPKEKCECEKEQKCAPEQKLCECEKNPEKSLDEAFTELLKKLGF